MANNFSAGQKMFSLYDALAGALQTHELSTYIYTPKHFMQFFAHTSIYICIFICGYGRVLTGKSLLNYRQKSVSIAKIEERNKTA